MGVIPLVTGGAVDMRRVIGYSGTVIFCSAIYFWLLARGTPSLEFVLRVVQLLFLINCIAIMGSGYLSAVFAYDVPGERSSGFFHNANEAGVMALYLVVLIAAVGPATATWVTLLKLAIAVTAIALTFSKTAYLVLMLLIILYLIAQRYYFTLSVSLLSAISVFPLAAYIVSVNPLDLSEEQKLRLQQVLQVFSGEIDNSVTTGRIDLWLLGVERIGNTFPFGGGIGTLHRMEGGYTDLAGDWLGVHNTFLAVLGEGGLVPFLIMLVLLFVLAQSSFNSLRPMLLSGILVVFTADLFVTHEVFKIRIHSLMLAVLMAACALEDKTQLKPPLRLPRPS